MLYLYPSNKLEHLSTLLNSVMQHVTQHASQHINQDVKQKSAAAPLQKRVLIVQHTGMQHWLSIQLARESGIAMQLDFPLPTRFVWETCRLILGNDAVPKQSPYKREVMVWRILDIIRSDAFEQSPHIDHLVRFWSHDDNKQQALQQFRFAQQLADLFEQYLVFRPDWILAWDANSDFEITSNDVFSQECYQWQKWFWRMLVQAQPNHPVVLQKQAMALLEAKQAALPEHIYLFAVNTMPKAYIAFFEALSAFTHVHWFHFNPCVDYWADAKSDKALARQMRMAPMQSWLQEEAHPLLRNFGKQGRDLLVQLMQSEHMEISAFDPPMLKPDTGHGLLQQLQSDILLGARNDNTANGQCAAENAQANSFNANTNIHVHACYSETRELQALKDFLLLQLEQDHSLGLDDILVMCPAIEDYSPFIKGIFESMDALHLASSISDRKPLESQASIVAFMHLLSMPDARFSSQKILSLLATPALLEKFSFSQTELDYCAQWIDRVRISFGLDATHKSALVSSPSASERYTWEWGLERLLSATFLSEEQGVGNSVAIAHSIDGQASVTVGKLIAFLSSLKTLVFELSQERDITQWREYLENILIRFFAPIAEDEFALSLIRQAINGLGEHSQLAQFSATVPINNLRQALDQSLSIPETKSRFMCGKITFCSMMPLRSIPFKVVAVLGLNQSTFPRSSYPSELDLIGKSPSRIGDRSRRDDDRYLFLEALLSVRSSFYLSYQYRSIQSNAEREPSLVLKELIEHCCHTYSPHSIQVVEHPLHPFSEHNFYDGTERYATNSPYATYAPSFSQAWLRHAKALQDLRLSATNKVHEVLTPQYFNQSADDNSRFSSEISLNALLTFFEEPMAFYANECLQLRFALPEVSDYSQPFDFDPLQVYTLRRNLFQHFFQAIPTQAIPSESSTTQTNSSQKSDNKASNSILFEQADHIEHASLLSGDLPELPDINAYLKKQKEQMQTLAECLQHDYCLTETSLVLTKAELSQIENNNAKQADMHDEDEYLNLLSLAVNCLVDEEHGMIFPVFKEKPKFKDQLHAWISYLMWVVISNMKSTMTSNSETPCQTSPEKRQICSIISVSHSRGKAKLKIDKLPEVNAIQAKSLLLNMLQWFKLGTQSPLFINRALIKDLSDFTNPSDAMADDGFRRKWNVQAQSKGGHEAYDALAINPYFHYFYADIPALTEAQLSVYFDVYLPMQRGYEVSE